MERIGLDMKHNANRLGSMGAATTIRKVTGIAPPIPTPLLDGRVDLVSLRRMLDALYENVDGILVGGSTGEAASLTVAERESVIRTVADHLRGECYIVASVADNSIENSRRLAETAGECDARLLILSCPSYFPNSRPMLIDYFGAIAEFAGNELCLYDNPVASNTFLTVDDVAALAEAVPSIRYVKMTDTALGKVRELREATDLTVHAGDDSVLWHHLISGVEGVMTAVPLVFPERTAEMWRAFRSGDLSGAFASYRQLSHFIHCGINTDYPAAVKAVLHDRGVLASPEVRPPLRGLSSVRRAEILAAC
jgi:4-hydroxy-tetrahydrodipicolinate synthase